MFDNYLDRDQLAEVETILGRTSLVGPIMFRNEDYDLVSQCLSMFDAAIELLRPQLLPGTVIKFCLVDSRSRNAVAFRLRSGDFCVALSGELVAIATITGGYFSMTSVMQEQFPLLPRSPSIRPDNYKSIPRGNPLPKLYRDEAMHRGMSDFGVGAVMAIMFHELAHILNGHLGYIGVGAISEMRDDAVDRQNVNVRRTLEFDADCASIKFMMRFFGLIPRQRISICQTHVEHMAFAIVSTFIAFTVFMVEEEYNPDWAQSNVLHPHPMDRFRACVATAVEVLKEFRSGEVNTDDEKLVFKLAGILIAAFQLIFDLPVGSENPDADEKAFIEHSNTMLSTWAEIRSQLTVHKMGTHNLAPINEIYRRPSK